MASAAVYLEQLDFDVDFLRNLCLFQIRKADTELAALCSSDEVGAGVFVFGQLIREVIGSAIFCVVVVV